MVRILLTLLTLTCFTACTTLQPLPDARPDTLQQIKPGTTVELERTDGSRQVLKVESVDADTLTGVHDNKRYQVPLASIRSVSQRTTSDRAKLWTTVGVIAALGAVIAISGGGDGSGGGGY